MPVYLIRSAMETGLKILLVEDDVALGKVWNLILASEGHEPNVCTSGASAIEVLDQGLIPDVVMTDYFLPDQNGIGLIDQIQARIPGVPCMLISGSREQSIIDSVHAREKVFFINKPVSLSALKQMLGEVGSGRKVS